MQKTRSDPAFSGTPFAGAYFIAQALAIAGWWGWLLQVPASRRHFVAQGAGEADLLAFLAPDLILAAPASLAAGVAFFRRSSWTVPLAFAAAGAMDYAFLYCVAWSLLRGGAWLNVVLMAPAALLSTVAAFDASAGVITIFRRAAPSPPSRHVLATALQVVAFWGTFLGLLPYAIAWVESQLGLPGLSFAGDHVVPAILFTGFSALGLTSGFTVAARGRGTPLPLAATSRLVITGPYAYVRNPMVIAGLGQGLAVALWLGSWSVLGYAVFGGVLWQTLVRPAEERDLVEYFGDEYLHYRAHVRCWVPRLRPYEGSRTIHT